MANLAADRIIQGIEQAAELYYRLIVLAAPAGTGKTETLRSVAQQLGIPSLNVNLELSRRMLDLTARQRALQLPRLLDKMVPASVTDVVLLDNIEILFDISLKQDPLRLLQGLSRNKTVVASWSGSIHGEYLIYADPGHAEHRRYPVKDLLIIQMEDSA